MGTVPAGDCPRFLSATVDVSDEHRGRSGRMDPDASGDADQTASDRDVKLKSRTRMAGIRSWKSLSSPARISGRPSSSILFSIVTGLSLKRKFLIGCLILPFSI